MKFKLLLGSMLIISLLLAACGPVEEGGQGIDELLGTDVIGQVTEAMGTALPDTGAAETEAGPVATEAGAVETEVGVPGTGAEETETMQTPLATETVEATEATEMAETPLATETVGATEATPEPTTEEAPGTTPQATGIPGTGMAAALGTLSTVMDAEVRDNTGQPVGTVNDMVLDLCNGEIQWVSIDGEANVFGDRTNPVLVPFDALSWNQGTGGGDGFFQLAVDPSSVQGSPDINLDEVDFNDPGWASEWEAFWTDLGFQVDTETGAGACDFTAAGAGAGQTGTGTPGATDEAGLGTPTATEAMGGLGTPGATDEGSMGTPAPTDAMGGTPGAGSGGSPVQGGLNTGISDQGVVLASSLMGMSVEDANGENIGEVEDILNSQAETIRFLLIAAGGLIGVAEDNIPVPPSALYYNPENNALVANIDAELLETAPTVDLENPADTAWISEAESFWAGYEVR